MSDETELRTLCDGRHLSLVARGHWEFATRKVRRSAIGVVALTDDDHIVLVEQFRLPVGRTVIELPAGLAGDVAGAEDEPLVEAAKRELLEETGYVARQWTELGMGFTSPGLTDESIVLFLAEGLEKTEAGGGDHSESITVHEAPLAGLLDWLDEHNATIDFKRLAGVFVVQSRRRHT
jgi:ADP-ribose pyrophosphatase